ncbi:MAG: 50S ribosomal protein L10 [Solirubrobacterales bacterium]
MNREQKEQAVAEIAEEINESQAVFAVDYRGITVAQVADVRSQLREADATLRVDKNTLTERAADSAGAEHLKGLLTGPTALTFVRGDAAAAAKAISTFNKETELLEFKGGMMDGEALEIDQIKAIAKLPSRDVLYGQLVGLVAAPIGGMVRGLGRMVGGLAIALAQLQEQKASEPKPEPEAPADEAPAEEAPAEEPESEEAPAGEAEEAPAEDPGEEPEAAAEEATAEEEAPAEESAGEAPEAEGAPEAEAEEAAAGDGDGEETSNEENEADASA